MSCWKHSAYTNIERSAEPTAIALYLLPIDLLLLPVGGSRQKKKQTNDKRNVSQPP
jgi:hypothetical protein